MRTGIFGGTFNPIHNGHINLVNKVLESIELDRILVFPTKIPPHKVVKNLIDGAFRLEMLNIAFSDNPKIKVSDYELLQEGKSYTIRTLEYLKEEYPEDEFFLIMGSDMILSFETWQRYKEIPKLCTIIGVSRSKDDTEKILKYSEFIESLGGKCIIVKYQPYEISSTQIRQMIADNQDYTCYLPEKVVKYIEYNNLYL